MKRKLLIVFAVLVAVASMVYVFAQHPGLGRGEGPKEKRMEMREFVDDLNLTPEQQLKMIDLRFAHHQEMLPLQKDLQKKRIELKSELDKESPNQQVLDKLTDEMSAIMAKIKKSKLHFLLSLKSVLTKEQWQEAKEHFIERDGEGCGNRERKEMRKGECRMGNRSDEMMPPPPPPPPQN